MATLLTLKRRIKTAQNVSKTTKAMQMIAASKLKRAQDATLSSRPYVKKLSFLSKSLSQRVEDKSLYPYFNENRQAQKTLLIVIAPDKGLCGALITNLLKEYLNLNKNMYYVVTIGKKIEKAASLSNNELVASFPFGTTLPLFDAIYPIAKIIEDYFLSKRVNLVQILSTEFVNVFVQKPVLFSILPVSLEENKEIEKETPFELFEPSVGELIPDLLKHYLEMVLYQRFLESYLSEQGARMMSMQNATNNAKDIIIQLTLDYNKARQAKITSEILDIIGGSIAHE